MDITAKQIRFLRRDFGLSQNAFAEKIGFSRSYVRDIELGKVEPSRKILKAISSECRVSVDWILFGEPIRKRTEVFMEKLNACLPCSDVDLLKRKKLYDHLKTIDNITEYEISFYIYKLLTLYREREIETKTLDLCFTGNYIIETPSAYHAFLGSPVKEDAFAENIIAYSILSTHSVYHRRQPVYDTATTGCPLKIKNNKLFDVSLNKFYEPYQLFKDTREKNASPMPSWPHEPRWKRKESIAKYFLEIDPDQASPHLHDKIRLSNVESSVIQLMRGIDQESLKDIYLLLASKGGRLGKDEKEKLKKDIANLKKAAK